MSCQIDGNPKTAKLLVVAMAPGAEELEQDAPLVGPTGHMLWTVLAKHGMSRADCFMVNVIGELPEKKTGPTQAQYEEYWDVVDKALQSFQGEVMLILGKDALWRTIGYTGIEQWRGYLIEPTDELPLLKRKIEVTEGVYKSGPKKGLPKTLKKTKLLQPVLPPNLKWIVPTLHPSGVMRTGMATLPVFAADVDRAVRALTGSLGAPRTEYTTVAAYDPTANYCAFDIETPNGYIERIAIATENGTWTAPWNAETKAITQTYLADPTVIKIAQNAPFDVSWLEGAGLYVDKTNLFDTMLMAVLLQPDLPKGLNYIGSLYSDCKRHKHLSSDQPEFYNARDASQELEIFHVMKCELDKTKQWELFERIIMPGVWVFMRMSKTGMYLDPLRRDAWIKTLSKELANALARWNKQYPGINPGSHVQLKNLFYNTFKCKRRYDKYGTLTINELALIETKLDYPEHTKIVDLILEIRGIEKDLKTYASVQQSSDGCVHPSYLPRSKDDDRIDDEGHKLGKELAGTWRPTAKGPNVQNVPKEARNMYTCRKKNHVFVEADFTAFEARILAALSKDDALKKAIDKGLHKTNMELIKVDKTRAKNGFYGWSYGAGAKTLQRTFKLKGFDISYKECRAMLNGFDTHYEKAAAWRDGQIALAKSRFYVENPFGLRRYFYTKSAGTAPANTPIQSTAAMIMWALMPAIEATALQHNGLLVGMVHDSVEFEIPSEHLESFKENLTSVMEQEFSNIEPGFHVPIEIKVGLSWGEVC